VGDLDDFTKLGNRAYLLSTLEIWKVGVVKGGMAEIRLVLSIFSVEYWLTLIIEGCFRRLVLMAAHDRYDGLSRPLIHTSCGNYHICWSKTWKHDLK
jgi:hypothetical protein